MAEAAFLHFALAHGLRVAKPHGDSDPYDFLAGNGSHFWRVQVKSCACLLANLMYQVGIGRHLGAPPSRRVIPYMPSEVDFIAIFLIPENSWYIVPIEVVDGRVGLSIHARNHLKFGPWRPYLEAWSLLDQTTERPVLPDPEPNTVSPRRRTRKSRSAQLLIVPRKENI